MKGDGLASDHRERPSNAPDLRAPEMLTVALLLGPRHELSIGVDTHKSTAQARALLKGGWMKLTAWLVAPSGVASVSSPGTVSSAGDSHAPPVPPPLPPAAVPVARRILRWGVLLGCLAIASSARTASADCAPRQVQCPCEYFADRYLARATVLEISATGDPTNGARPVKLRIDQILNPDAFLTQADTQLVLSAKTYVTSLACDATEREAPQVGDTVLAVIAYPVRSGDQLADNSVVLMPWGETLELGNGTAEPVSEVVKLAEIPACDARFPPPPNQCQDTNVMCAVSGAPASPEASGAWAALLGIATLGMVMRRLKRRSLSLPKWH